MNTCKKCGGQFSSSTHIDGRLRYLHKRKYCLRCSPFGSNGPHNMRLLKRIKTKICTACHRTLNVNNFYVKKRCKGFGPYISHHYICKECFNERTVQEMKSKKAMAVELLGGKCMDCGYHRSLSALEFHHRNPKHKDFVLSVMRSRNWKLISSELKKCDLVCANCHRERHDNLNGGRRYTTR